MAFNQPVEHNFEHSQLDKVYNPLELGRMLILNRGEKIYGFVLETSFEKDVIRRLVKIAEDTGVIIRFIQFSCIEPHEGLAKMLVFADFSNTSVTPEEVLRLAKEHPFVKNIILIPPVRNTVLSDTHFFPLTVGKRRAVIFRRRVYESLFNGVREKFGTAGEAVLYYQGFSIGHRTCQVYREDTGFKKPEELLEFLKIYYRTMGWGIIDVINFNAKKGEACIRLYQSFECEVGNGSKESYGQFIRGMLAGFFTNMFGKEVKAIESKCIAKGDTFCEYIIGV